MSSSSLQTPWQTMKTNLWYVHVRNTLYSFGIKNSQVSASRTLCEQKNHFVLAKVSAIVVMLCACTCTCVCTVVHVHVHVHVAMKANGVMCIFILASFNFRFSATMVRFSLFLSEHSDLHPISHVSTH